MLWCPGPVIDRPVIIFVTASCFRSLGTASNKCPQRTTTHSMSIIPQLHRSPNYRYTHTQLILTPRTFFFFDDLWSSISTGTPLHLFRLCCCYAVCMMFHFSTRCCPLLSKVSATYLPLHRKLLCLLYIVSKHPAFLLGPDFRR